MRDNPFFDWAYTPLQEHNLCPTGKAACNVVLEQFCNLYDDIQIQTTNFVWNLANLLVRLSKHFVLLLMNILYIEHRRLFSGSHISRPVKCQFIKMSIQSNQSPAKYQKIWIKMCKLLHGDQCKIIHQLSHMIWISYGIHREIIMEKPDYALCCCKVWQFDIWWGMEEEMNFLYTFPSVLFWRGW